MVCLSKEGVRKVLEDLDKVETFGERFKEVGILWSGRCQEKQGSFYMIGYLNFI